MGKLLIGKDAASSKPIANNQNSVFINSVYSRIEALENTVTNIEQKNLELKKSDFNLLESLEFKQIEQNIQNINKKISIIEELSNQFKNINTSLVNVSDAMSNFEKNTEFKNDLLISEIKEKSKNNDLNFKLVLSDNSSIQVFLNNLSDSFKELDKKIKQLQFENNKHYNTLSTQLSMLNENISYQLRELNLTDIHSELAKISLTQNSAIVEFVDFYDKQNQLISEYNKKQKILIIGVGLSIFISTISIVVNLL